MALVNSTAFRLAFILLLLKVSAVASASADDRKARTKMHARLRRKAQSADAATTDTLLHVQPVGSDLDDQTAAVESNGPHSDEDDSVYDGGDDDDDNALVGFSDTLPANASAVEPFSRNDRFGPLPETKKRLGRCGEGGRGPPQTFQCGGSDITGKVKLASNIDCNGYELVIDGGQLDCGGMVIKGEEAALITLKNGGTLKNCYLLNFDVDTTNGDPIITVEGGGNKIEDIVISGGVGKAIHIKVGQDNDETNVIKNVKILATESDSNNDGVIEVHKDSTTPTKMENVMISGTKFYNSGILLRGTGAVEMKNIDIMFMSGGSAESNGVSFKVPGAYTSCGKGSYPKGKDLEVKIKNLSVAHNKGSGLLYGNCNTATEGAGLFKCENCVFISNGDSSSSISNSDVAIKNEVDNDVGNKFILKNVVIAGNKVDEYALLAEDSDDVEITGGNIAFNTGNGIYYDADGSLLKLSDVIVEMNGDTGIDASGTSTVQFDKTVVSCNNMFFDIAVTTAVTLEVDDHPICSKDNIADSTAALNCPGGGAYVCPAQVYEAFTADCE